MEFTKIQNMSGAKIARLVLPKKNYGPLCLMILQKFAKHHKIPITETSLPSGANQSPHDVFTKIFDVMLHSMGSDKRLEIIAEVNKYNKDIGEL